MKFKDITSDVMKNEIDYDNTGKYGLSYVKEQETDDDKENPFIITYPIKNGHDEFWVFLNKDTIYKKYK